MLGRKLQLNGSWAQGTVVGGIGGESTRFTANELVRPLKLLFQIQLRFTGHVTV